MSGLGQSVARPKDAGPTDVGVTGVGVTYTRPSDEGRAGKSWLDTGLLDAEKSDARVSGAGSAVAELTGDCTGKNRENRSETATRNLSGSANRPLPGAVKISPGPVTAAPEPAAIASVAGSARLARALAKSDDALIWSATSGVGAPFARAKIAVGTVSTVRTGKARFGTADSLTSAAANSAPTAARS